MTDNHNYEEYKTILQKAADLNNATAVLSWDQEVYMPPKGAYFRGRQIATLAGQAHELLTSNQLSNLLDELQKDEGLNDLQKANIQRSHEDLQKNKQLPPSFVEELSTLTSECYNAWIAARKKNDFNMFAPFLKKMVALNRKKASLFGYKEHPYDALLDEYEPGATVAMLDRVFDGVKSELPPILKKITAATQVDDSCFGAYFPKDSQWNFSIEVLQAMGYDFEAGRQDYSEHPFTTSFSPADVRVTTRVSEHDFASLLWSTIHEGGHALYEQGLPESEYGLPLGAAASLGIHESQSRLWENCIGRGLHFWKHFYPILQARFPEQLSNVTLEHFYRAANKVQPSLIRTEADEVTYHFHVLIRYEIEKALIESTLEVEDVRARWNELYQKYLGITPPDDKTGILQDIHWSHGSFGYFPTYTLGSFYAAQFFSKAQDSIPDLLQQIERGETTELLNWLRDGVHKHGRRYYSEELCERVTGSKLDTSHFLTYITEKYSKVYGVDFTE